MAESFAATFGCMFIAFAIDTVCYGAGLLLTLQYFVSFKADVFRIRLLVFVLAFLATVHIITFFAWVYVDLIVRFGLAAELDSMPRTALVQLLAIYLTAFCSQCFFTSRIWILSKHNVFLTAPIATLALLQISAGIAQTTLSGIGGTFSHLVHTEVVTTIQSGATAACDVSITCILCYVLHGSRTGMKNTDTVLDKLILYTINRGALTSVAALLNMILFVWRPTAMIFMIPLLPSCQFYIVSVVATLNSRKSIRENLTRSRDRSDGVSLPLAPMPGGHSTKHVESGVHITTQVVTWGSGNDHEYDASGSQKGSAAV